MDKLCYEVESGLLYGRPGPAVAKWNLAYFQSQGLRAIISLVPTASSEDILRAGLAHCSIPFENKFRTPYKTANSFLRPILAAFDDIIERHLPRQEPVLVHCNAGKDRTGFLLGYFLVVYKGLSPKRALRRLRQLKPDALTANDFENAFYALAASWRPMASRGRFKPPYGKGASHGQ